MEGKSADIELFTRTQAGDATAYEMLFNRYWHALYLFAYKLLQSRDEAKDVTQSIFLYIWEKREQIAIHDSVKSYLYQAVRYRSLNRLKELLESPDNIEAIHERLQPVFNDILQAMEYKDLTLIVEKHVSDLPARMQQIFRLSRYQQLTIEEIAHRLGLSEQTVKNQLSGAVKILRQSILFELFVFYVWH